MDAATAPLTTQDGLTVELPADWQRTQVGNRAYAQERNGFGLFQYGAAERRRWHN